MVRKEFDLVKDVISVVSVTVTEEELTLIVKLIPFLGSLVSEDETLLSQTFTDVYVDALEPVLELWILISITVDLVERVEQVVKGSEVGESLNKSLELC